MFTLTLIFIISFFPFQRGTTRNTAGFRVEWRAIAVYVVPGCRTSSFQ
jgi:hypothetical protein